MPCKREATAQSNTFPQAGSGFSNKISRCLVLPLLLQGVGNELAPGASGQLEQPAPLQRRVRKSKEKTAPPVCLGDPTSFKLQNQAFDVRQLWVEIFTVILLLLVAGISLEGGKKCMDHFQEETCSLLHQASPSSDGGTGAQL